MLELMLIAQLMGPWCGQYGSTPFNNGSLGCVVPSDDNPYGTTLYPDPYSPGGIGSESAAPAPLPKLTGGDQQ